jgi:hypothetical protein
MEQQTDKHNMKYLASWQPAAAAEGVDASHERQGLPQVKQQLQVCKFCKLAVAALLYKPYASEAGVPA